MKKDNKQKDRSRSCQKLREEEREELIVFLNKGVSIREIARRLKRSASTIRREVNKNGGRIKYRTVKAQQKAESNKKNKRRMTILKSYGVQIEVEKGLAKGYSPEIIANRLRIEHLHLPTISYEAIYQWIYRDRQDLIYYLLRCNK
ncbi:MAG: helix-turn-helix domain-containing protein [Elusimicrobiota bacterium]|jgi:IS30 family transposase|nr:helix-turn-helix domain-containing protein [Elusimicrobiota bacterium]